MFAVRFLNKARISPGKKRITAIPMDNHKPSGSSYETVLGPVGCLAAIKIAAIASINVVRPSETFDT